MLCVMSMAPQFFWRQIINSEIAIEFLTVSLTNKQLSNFLENIFQVFKTK